MTADPVRDELLDLLRHASAAAPEVRFGQLVANLAFLAAGPWDKALWDVEDAQIVDALRQHLDDLARREEPVAAR